MQHGSLPTNTELEVSHPKWEVPQGACVALTILTMPVGKQVRCESGMFVSGEDYWGLGANGKKDTRRDLLPLSFTFSLHWGQYPRVLG